MSFTPILMPERVAVFVPDGLDAVAEDDARLDPGVAVGAVHQLGNVLFGQFFVDVLELDAGGQAAPYEDTAGRGVGELASSMRTLMRACILTDRRQGRLPLPTGRRRPCLRPFRRNVPRSCNTGRGPCPEKAR